MKSIYQLCNDKGITIKQLFQEINKPFKFIKDAEWRNMLNLNEFNNKVATKICDILDVGLLEIDINTSNQLEKPKLSPVKSESFKKADFSKISNMPKASDKVCTGKFGQCKSSNGVQRAHYTGEFQSLFGKGRGQRVHDLYSAYLCSGNGGCHERLDQPKNRKDHEASHEFSIAINLSRKFDYDNGYLIYKTK